jgi:hypothetical protein
MTDNERHRNLCISLADSVMQGLATLPVGRWSDDEYRDLYRTLSDIENRIYRKGEYAPENVARAGK